jgi:hypothetical protein
MREPTEYRLVGGPMDGQTITTCADVIELDGTLDMVYHWTLPTDTNWRETMDPDWFARGKPEPVAPQPVMEWHERGWVSPEVGMIREAVRKASGRLCRSPEQREPPSA